MKLKITDCLGFYETYLTLTNVPFSVQTFFNLARLAREVIPNREIYQTQLSTIFEKYAQTTPDGTFVRSEGEIGYKIKPGLEEECAEKLRELNNIEVELPDIYFKLSDFEGVDLTPARMITLIPFIKD